MPFDTSPISMGQHLAKSKASFEETISGFSKIVSFIVGTKNVFAEQQKAVIKGDLNNDKKVNLADLVIEVRLTKDINKYANRGPHVAAAEIAAQKGIITGRGYRARFIVNKGDGKISNRVVLEEDARLENYDPDYYIDNQIMRAVYKIFEIFNYDTEKLKAGQTTLGSF
ncbi:MAG: hypothetical protein HYT16_00455 [DPANN group archaeon]|nr:hypothetical protein [DPANN group archaeon]